MIIPITFASSSTSRPRAQPLPPGLAQIAHGEVVLVELQGALEVECNDPSERDGRLVGTLALGEKNVSHCRSPPQKSRGGRHRHPTTRAAAPTSPLGYFPEIQTSVPAFHHFLPGHPPSLPTPHHAPKPFPARLESNFAPYTL